MGALAKEMPQGSAMRALDPEALGVWHGEVDAGVDAGDGLVRFAMAGDIEAGGVPLILLHGWTLDWRMWLPQVEALSQRHFLVMPDRRGCGRSTAPPDLAREADDVQRIADFLGFERFALIGLSQGAAVALDCAGRHAFRLSALVVSGAPIPYLVERDEVIALDLYEAWAREGNLEALRAHWSGHDLMRRSNPATAPLIEAMLADYDARDLLAPSDLNGVPKDTLEHLPVPLLATTGTGDTAWRRACARRLGEAAPRGRSALIEGAGHLANLDQPDRFNTLVGNFLETCARGANHKA